MKERYSQWRLQYCLVVIVWALVGVVVMASGRLPRSVMTTTYSLNLPVSF